VPVATRGPDSAVLEQRNSSEASLATALNARSSAAEDRLVRVLAAEVDVWAEPSVESRKLGTLRAGGFARLREGNALVAHSADCSSGWYAVEPRGFLCEGDGVTRDPGQRTAQLLAEYALARHAALPASYGFCEGSPLYARVPTAVEREAYEPGREARRGQRVERPDPAMDLPEAFRAGTLAPSRPKSIDPGSPVVGTLDGLAKLAWVAEFAAEESTWLLTPELLFVPADRVKRAVISGFHGIAVPANAGIAMTGHQAVPQYRRDDDGHRFLPQRDTWPANSPVLLSEPILRWSDDKFLETADPGVFVRATDVLVAHPTPPSRWGLDPDARFIEVIARTNLLIVHEGDRITYVTLASVGRDTFARGKYRLFSKHLTAPSLLDVPHPATRAAEIPEVMRLTDTPDAPNDATVLTLYAAWWISAWGSAIPGNGIALAPLDARYLFDATEPALPDGWHSVRADGTWLVIHD
jgi:hypothetical protein